MRWVGDFATTDARPGRREARRQVAGGGVGAPRGPAHAIFARDDALRYKASAKKSGASASRLEMCRNARSVGEFFDSHPGSPATARKDLAWDLARGLCDIPGFVARSNLKDVRLGPAGPARAAAGAACADAGATSPASRAPAGKPALAKTPARSGHGSGAEA